MSGLNYQEVINWSVDDVLGWLGKVNLSEFSDFVSREKIDGPNLIQLDKGTISNCKVPKTKREALLKRLKDFEKEKLKMQKSTKGDPKTANGRAVPVINPPPPTLVRGAPPQPDDDGDEFIEDDDDEWDDDQGVYDNDEISQPAKRRSQKPPPPPIDTDSDEDYISPVEPNTPPSFRPPQPPSDDNDDNLYERANQAMIPGKSVPPPRTSPAAPQRTVPPAPAQGPNVPPPRGGGRAPVAPSHQPILYEEAELGPNVPPPRGGGRAPVAPPLDSTFYEETAQGSPPRSPSPPPPPAPPSGPKQSRQHRPMPQPPEMNEVTAQDQPPALLRSREGRPVPPRPPTEISEDPKEEGPVGPDYESVEELQAKMNEVTAPARMPLPVPAAQRDLEEKTAQKAQPARSARPPPSIPVDDDIYEAADEEVPPPRSARQPPLKPAADEFYEASGEQVSLSRSGRPPLPKPEVNEFYEPTDEQVPPARSAFPPLQKPTADEFYEATDEQVPPIRSARPPQSKPAADEFYEPTDEQRIPLPPPPPGHRKAGRPRAAPPLPAEDPDAETGESPQANRKYEDERPQRPEKLLIDKKVPAGLPTTVFPINTVVVRDAKTKLRSPIPKDFAEERTTKDKPNRQQENVKGVGGIREIFQAKSDPKTSVTAPKKTPAAPPVAKTPVSPPSQQTTENNAPGAPEPRKRRQERDPLPGPPGAPPETVKRPAAAASPATDPNDITTRPWYFGDCDRVKANEMLKQSKEEGTYLVRDSKGSGQPYTLCIYYRGDTFNIAIRKRPDGKYALGTEKPDEHVFETIGDLIRFHRNNAIEVSKTGNLAGRVKLAKVAGK